MPEPRPRLPSIREESVTATKQHTYPPPEDSPPLQRRLPASRPDAPFKELTGHLEDLTEQVDRISQLHIEAFKPTDEEVEKVKMRRAWNKIVLSIGGSIATILAVVAFYFGFWAKNTLEPKLSDAKAVQVVQVTELDKLETRIKALEKYDRKKHVRDLCLQSMEHSAFARGTGHDLVPLVDTGVHWTTENMPKLQLRAIWDAPPFYPLTQCPPEPVPPGCNQIGCPDE